MRIRGKTDGYGDGKRVAKIRYDALVRSGGVCECCAHPGSIENPLEVDHIKPVSKHPDLRWEFGIRVKQAMVALEIKAKAATFPVFHVKFRSRPILPEPDFSLEEIEQAKTVIEDLSR